eukprot:3575190-Lingulodinium_polyedra.AAC.1
MANATQKCLEQVPTVSHLLSLHRTTSQELMRQVSSLEIISGRPWAASVMYIRPSSKLYARV